MINKTVTIRNSSIESVIEYLERITAQDPKELLDPLTTGWSYILDMVETPRRPGGRILVKLQRQKSVVNKERDRLTIDCILSHEDLVTNKTYSDPAIHQAVFFEVHKTTETSVDITGGYEDLNYFQIVPYFISIWNQMCKAFGSLEGQIKDSVSMDATPEERDVWERILARTLID